MIEELVADPIGLHHSHVERVEAMDTTDQLEIGPSPFELPDGMDHVGGVARAECAIAPLDVGGSAVSELVRRIGEPCEEFGSRRHGAISRRVRRQRGDAASPRPR